MRNRPRSVLGFTLAVALLGASFGVDTVTSPAGAASLSVVALSAGGAATCAITADDAVHCWGDNSEGQAGNGTVSGPRPGLISPVDVSGLPAATSAISATGTHTCALSAAGEIRCWGESFNGEIGDGTTGGPAGACGRPCEPTPVDGPGLTSGVAISGSCAVTAAGGVKCWGDNVNGELGNGAAGSQNCGGAQCSPTPVDVVGLSSGVASVSGDDSHACALTTAGGVKCWGANEVGQLGDGTHAGPDSCSPNPCSRTPVDVVGLSSGVAQISVGGDSTCVVTSAGGVKCWGLNRYGQVGDGSNPGPDNCDTPFHFVACSMTPVDVAGLTSGVAKVSVGGSSACALLAAGAVKCWGLNVAGELGIASSTGPSTCFVNSSCSPTPLDVLGLSSHVVDIAVGDLHACAVTDAGHASCWGSNEWGQLGAGVFPGPETCATGNGGSCSTVPLSVAGPDVPSAPANIVVTPQVAGASVHFDPSTFVGGGPIDHYTATCTSSDGGAPNTASGAASPIHVFALTVGHSYTCSMTATNPYGTSPPSANSSAFLPLTLRVVVAPTHFEFGAQRIGTYGPRPTHVANVTNRGTAALTVTSVSVTGAHPRDFFGATDCLASGHPRVLAPGASCQVIMFFGPLAPGPRAGTLLIRDTASDSPQHVTLTGHGTEGYFIAGAHGEVGAFGDAVYHGDATHSHLRAPIISLTTTPNGAGYWLLGRDGGIFTYGNARFFGSTGAKHLNRPIVGMAATRSGRGYWLVASDGGIFTYGDARFFGSTGARHLNSPIVAMAATRTGKGYWLLAGDGAVFAFGDAGYYGSTHASSRQLAPTPTGHGYWILASDGLVSAHGDASRHGSAVNQSIVGMAVTPDGRGYWQVTRGGHVLSFGDAPMYGNLPAGIGDVVAIAGTAPVSRLFATLSGLDPVRNAHQVQPTRGRIATNRRPLS